MFYKLSKKLQLLKNLVVICLILPIYSCSQTNNQVNTEKYNYVASTNDWLDTTPVRGDIGPLLIKRTGFEYTCNECHQDLNSRQKYYQPAGEHRNISLDHGLNVSCLNCHHQEDRNYYSDYGDGKIAPEESYRVCMKCHGPIYRDWEANIHGRVNGYWDAGLGPQLKLDCVQCHDPHSPQFKPLVPMPKPEFSRTKTSIQGDHHE